MTAVPPLAVTEFGDFFREVHGNEGVPGPEPFPWQVRLLHQVATTGWPRLLDLPTGSGKTAAIDIAVFALALDAATDPRTAPLRIVYVVDRRTVVDQAYERAEKLRRALAAPQSDVVRRMRDRLAKNHDQIPLRTALLRGGIARDDMWARTPDQPLVAVSTVDQVGSRLLFRGYGVSDSMKPVHAGLLGCDVLYLLDEVHLSHPFRETLAAIGKRYRFWAERALHAPFAVVEMSATPGRTERNGGPGELREAPFSLDDDDRQHPVLSRRLRTSKPVALSSATARTFAKQVEQEVVDRQRRIGSATAVIVNRVGTAREIHERLGAALSGGLGTIHLLTGRMRPFDRARVDAALLPRIRAGRSRNPDDKPVVVVSTQTIEAGADFDFDDMITECASLDALRQRFGRLDRMGELGGKGFGAVIARNDSFKDDAVYGDAIGKTWEWLQALSKNGMVDFGLQGLDVPEDAEERGLLAPKPNAPVLLPSHLDAWVQTSPIPQADPDVALWLHGPERGVPDVQIVWRADITAELLQKGANGSVAACEIAIDMLEALPPVSAEAMQVPFAAARAWLQNRRQRAIDFADVEGAHDPEDEATVWSDALARCAVVWQGDDSHVIHASDMRPGQTIVVPCTYGGIGDHLNWDPASTTPVGDIAELASLQAGRPPTLRLHPVTLPALLGQETQVPIPPPADSEDAHDSDTFASWLARVVQSTTNEPVRTLLQQLPRTGSGLRVERFALDVEEGSSQYYVLTGRPADRVADPSASTETRKSSFLGVEVSLAAHTDGVAELTGGFAARAGVAPDVADDLRLAAQWHDSGKADIRFQRWLHGGSEYKALVQPELLAKSRVRLSNLTKIREARERAGYPQGGRHELTSLALVSAIASDLSERGGGDWSLVQHLIAAHHGFCRPLAPCVRDDHAVEVTFSRDGLTSQVSSADEFAKLDSGVAERFWQMIRRYGWWGLAWLEAQLRLADHRQSEREETERRRSDV